MAEQDDLEPLGETLDVMDSASLLSDIRESLAEIGTAAAPTLSKEEALRLIDDQQQLGEAGGTGGRLRAGI